MLFHTSEHQVLETWKNYANNPELCTSAERNSSSQSSIPEEMMEEFDYYSVT